ncbi:MAG: hypothetical protein Q9170_005597 [Blastenia crenularia]
MLSSITNQQARIYCTLLALIASIFLLLASQKSSQSHPPVSGNPSGPRRDLGHSSPVGPGQHQVRKRVARPFGVGTYGQNFSLITKRAATFEQLVCKGERMLDMILHNPPSTRVFTRQDQVDAWEVRSGEDELGYDETISEDMVPALQALGIPHNREAITDVTSYQNLEYTGPDGRRYPPTRGEYTNLYIPDDQKGAIVAKSIYSPAYQAGRQGRPNQPLPALNRWSDVAWQNWTAIAKSQTNKLRYILRYSVTTNVVRELIEYIEVAAPDSLNLPWPGTVYDLLSDDGKALLGSVHGVGIGWLIVDHSDVLGRKIPAVRIWTTRSIDEYKPNRWWYHMMWELRDTVTGP